MMHVCVAFLAVTIFVHAHQNSQNPSERLDLAGQWVLNDSLSEDLPLLPGEAMSLARASGVVPAGSAPARATHGPDPAQVTLVRNILRSALRASAQLKIVQNGQVLVFTDAEGRVLPVRPDGRETRHEHGGVRFSLVAHWKAPLLTVRRQYPDGTVLSDSYATFTEPRQLVATSTISNRRMAEQPVTIRRVYNAVQY
jgi:hypothetical protein